MTSEKCCLHIRTHCTDKLEHFYKFGFLLAYLFITYIIVYAALFLLEPETLPFLVSSHFWWFQEVSLPVYKAWQQIHVYSRACAGLRWWFVFTTVAVHLPAVGGAREHKRAEFTSNASTVSSLNTWIKMVRREPTSLCWLLHLTTSIDITAWLNTVGDSPPPLNVQYLFM